MRELVKTWVDMKNKTVVFFSRYVHPVVQVGVALGDDEYSWIQITVVDPGEPFRLDGQFWISANLNTMKYENKLTMKSDNRKFSRLNVRLLARFDRK